MRTIRISLFLLLALALTGVCTAAATNYSQDVAIKKAKPSPVDSVTGSSVNQFGADQTNSQVDNYIYQDEQIDVKPGDGTIRVLRTNQKNNLNDYVPKLIPVKRAKPRELRVIAREITGMEGGTAEVFIDPKTKEAGIYVVVPRFMLPYIEQAIHDLDKEWLNPTDDGTVTEVYSGKFRDVRQSVPLATIATTLDYTASFDINKNAATFTEDPDQMKAFNTFMGLVDVPVNEIYVDAKFIEINMDEEQKLGLDYIAWKNGPGRDLFEFILAGEHNWEKYRGASSIFNPLTPSLAPPADGGYAHFETEGNQRYANFNYYITSSYLDFLQSKDKAKVLVAPKLQTRSGRLAQWAGIEPIASISVTGTDNKTPFNLDDKRASLADDTTGDLGSWDRFVNYTKHDLQAGTFLDIQPFIGTKTTEMFVAATISSINGFTPAGAPIIASRSVASEVRTKDGQTLVLGGLHRLEKVKTKAGIPWLSEIPVLGYLFGSETTADRETTVLVTLNTVTSVGSASKMEIPKPMATVMTQVSGPEMSKTPKTSFGFDQWLLDPEKLPASQSPR